MSRIEGDEEVACLRSVKATTFVCQRMGVAPDRLLHVAESLFHDIDPAKKLGLSTVWVHRRAEKGGFGATPSAEAEADLEVPDLKTLVSSMGL